MPVAAAVGGAALIGGIAGNEANRKAASKAAGAQENATNSQIASQERMFDRQMEAFAPFQQMGYGSLPTLMQLSGYNVGMSTPEMEQQYIQQKIATDPELQGLRAQLAGLPQSNSFGGGISGAIKAMINSKQRSDLAKRIDAMTKDITGNAFGDNPLYQMNGQYYSRSPLAKMEESPGYKFQLEQGERNTNRALAARGKYDSGQAFGILNDNVYRPLATQEADKFYNRQLGLAGIGQGAAGQVAGAAQNYGNNMTGIYGKQGQNQADAYLARGKQQAGLYSSLGSLPMNALGTYALGKQAGLWGQGGGSTFADGSAYNEAY